MRPENDPIRATGRETRLDVLLQDMQGLEQDAGQIADPIARERLLARVRDSMFSLQSERDRTR